MKKVFIYSMMLLVSISMASALSAQIAISKKGVISPNSENENNEADPPFVPFNASTSLLKKSPQPTNQQNISEVEGGLQLVQDIFNRMMNNEYSFALLASHKYNINGCLGLKVSAGTFKLKFQAPHVELRQNGEFAVTLKVNRIEFNALKLRMKPCSKPEHITHPCHYGTKFDVGGEATDVSLTAKMKLMTNGLTGTQAFCFLNFDGKIDFVWKIGGINLKPMQNNLDNLSRDIIEDALNGGMDDFFFNKFIQMSRQVIPQYYSFCEGAYSLHNQVGNTTGMVANNAGTPQGDSMSGKKDDLKWDITAVPNMKGVLGRLNTQFPADVDWSIDIRNTENKFITNRSSYSKHGNAQEVAPGTYNFELNSITVENVPIEKGKLTRLKTGVLNIVSQGNWELYDDTQKKFQTSGNKPKKFALPVGNYQLKLGGQFFPVVIKDGKVEEF